jgi:hypothetical protein
MDDAWTCSKCGEVSEDVFTSCWQCGSASPNASKLPLESVAEEVGEPEPVPPVPGWRYSTRSLLLLTSSVAVLAAANSRSGDVLFLSGLVLLVVVGAAATTALAWTVIQVAYGVADWVRHYVRNGRK